MKIRTTNRRESEILMKKWIEKVESRENGEELKELLNNDIDNDYIIIREKLEVFFLETDNSWNSNIATLDYYRDVDFGIKLYIYFKELFGLNLRIASNFNFWRYLSIVIIPHIVAKRWGYDNEDHYWKKPLRIWLATIWWYIHLSWQGNAEDTKKLLLKFNTDIVLNLVERSGKEGRNFEVSNLIMKVYGYLPKETIAAYGNKTQKSDSLFRAVMRLNTARIIVSEPAFCQGGVRGYVLGLYKAVGVNQNLLNQISESINTLNPSPETIRLIEGNKTETEKEIGNIIESSTNKISSDENNNNEEENDIETPNNDNNKDLNIKVLWKS